MLKIYEKIALSHYLSEFAYDLSLKTNLQKLVNNGEADSDMVPCEIYENSLSRESIADEIESLSESIKNGMDAIDDEWLLKFNSKNLAEYRLKLAKIEKIFEEKLKWD